jgi:hypothetical protein
MGVWGTAIFSDDLAADVRDGYTAALDEGCTAEEATKRVLEEFAEAMVDPSEANVVWLALAASQVKWGGLQDDVHLRACEIIDSGADLERWEESPPNKRKRIAVLARLREQLDIPASERKVVKRTRHRERYTEGDVFSIALPNGRVGYAQYVHHDTERLAAMGHLIRVFAETTDEVVDIEKLAIPRNEAPPTLLNRIGRSLGFAKPPVARYAFPPVFVILDVSVRMGYFKKIGHVPVTDFQFPLFRTTNGTKPGVYHDWGLWDRGRDTFLGDLPAKYRGLEIRCIWGADLVADRIVSGHTIDYEIL